MIEHFHDWSWGLMMISGVGLFLCLASIIIDRNNEAKDHTTYSISYTQIERTICR